VQLRVESMSKRKKDEIIESVSAGRREFVRKALKTGYVLPVVGTFTMTGLMAKPAAALSNQSI